MNIHVLSEEKIMLKCTRVRTNDDFKTKGRRVRLSGKAGGANKNKRKANNIKDKSSKSSNTQQNIIVKQNYRGMVVNRIKLLSYNNV